MGIFYTKAPALQTARDTAKIAFAFPARLAMFYKVKMRKTMNK
jgi:hypothetical protein